MRLPRMTTRQLIVAVIVLALWLAFVARSQRLRGIGSYHMQQYSSQSRVALELRERRRAEEADAVKAQAMRHLRSAEASNVEADFVESFTLALFLSALVFGLVWLVRRGREGVKLSPPAGAG